MAKVAVFLALFLFTVPAQAALEMRLTPRTATWGNNAPLTPCRTSGYETQQRILTANCKGLHYAEWATADGKYKILSVPDQWGCYPTKVTATPDAASRIGFTVTMDYHDCKDER